MDANDKSDNLALIDKLRDYWVRSKILVRPGVSVREIEAFESHYRVRMPTDLRSYFTTFNGMEPGFSDSEVFSFLPLNAVKSIPEELAFFGGIPDYTQITQSLPDPESWFVIVDFLISSNVFAIRLCADAEDTPVLAIGGGTHYRVVASSYSGFLEAYLADPLGLTY